MNDSLCQDNSQIDFINPSQGFMSKSNSPPFRNHQQKTLFNMEDHNSLANTLNKKEDHIDQQIDCIIQNDKIAIYEIEYQGSTDTWQHLMNLQNKDWLSQYIHCVYWSVSTMVTILLYIPNTNLEIIFAVGSMFIMNGAYG
ncbi:hypothetical protein PPERSA_06937 [Pseudocohnilembus persalinus]|uniref:Uncharacterized protein n=1 Tax=Pseudocohnilembus persalinus TaxID=266149 RepID=A0A0V0QZ30_PSEPJ|nr:hypothetical protein PPERSA_06937 [Pseudocohnilembus persalinus]|eukprot:KRX07322.1 hypothetical protein PPERSA_06937 [Pseudocohnilembus persalinus]